jgi:anti-sigma factor RsiW
LSKLHKAIHPRRTRPWQWALAAAAVVVSVGVGTRALEAADGHSPELVSAHLRSLQNPAHLTDVASSDRHTVKPYFQGRIDYAFTVRDFADAGYPLEGGRVDVLGERPVAALVYRSNAHVINAFVQRTGLPSRERAWSRNGFNLYRFDDAEGDTVELISDVSPETLAGLARAWRE